MFFRLLGLLDVEFGVGDGLIAFLLGICGDRLSLNEDVVGLLDLGVGGLLHGLEDGLDGFEISLGKVVLVLLGSLGSLSVLLVSLSVLLVSLDVLLGSLSLGSLSVLLISLDILFVSHDFVLVNHDILLGSSLGLMLFVVFFSFNRVVFVTLSMYLQAKSTTVFCNDCLMLCGIDDRIFVL